MQFEALHKMVMDKLATGLPAYLTYHNATHTKNVLAAAIEIGQTESQIIPIIVHSTEQALSLHTHLAHDNILAPVIRPPTVPAGSSRVRLVLHSGLENTHMTQLIDSLNRWSTLNAHSVA